MQATQTVLVTNNKTITGDAGISSLNAMETSKRKRTEEEGEETDDEEADDLEKKKPRKARKSVQDFRDVFKWVKELEVVLQKIRSNAEIEKDLETHVLRSGKYTAKAVSKFEWILGVKNPIFFFPGTWCFEFVGYQPENSRAKKYMEEMGAEQGVDWVMVDALKLNGMLKSSEEIACVGGFHTVSFEGKMLVVGNLVPECEFKKVSGDYVYCSTRMLFALLFKKEVKGFNSMGFLQLLEGVREFLKLPSTVQQPPQSRSSSTDEVTDEVSVVVPTPSPTTTESAFVTGKYPPEVVRELVKLYMTKSFTVYLQSQNFWNAYSDTTKGKWNKLAENASNHFMSFKGKVDTDFESVVEGLLPLSVAFAMKMNEVVSKKKPRTSSRFQENGVSDAETEKLQLKIQELEQERTALKKELQQVSQEKEKSSNDNAQGGGEVENLRLQIADLQRQLLQSSVDSCHSDVLEKARKVAEEKRASGDEKEREICDAAIKELNRQEKLNKLFVLKEEIEVKSVIMEMETSLEQHKLTKARQAHEDFIKQAELLHKELEKEIGE